MKLQYNIYPSLLDRFQDYLSSYEIYQTYWGFSETPEMSEEDFEYKQFTELINSINRVPYESEAADKGTAFNEVVDCIIQNRKSEKMDITRNEGLIEVRFKEWIFAFPVDLCREFASYYKGAVQQVYTEGILETSHGLVKLYGFIDQLLPLSVHDIKTSSRYSAGKYIRNWQHIVYPYCLNQSGNNVCDFEYNVAVMNTTKMGINYSTHTECYSFSEERDTERLRVHVDRFIDFLELNRDLITDRKVFNM